MLFGYVRVSTKSQDDRNGTARQREALINYGVDPQNIYEDVMSGSKASRPGLNEMKKYLRPNDVVVVSELSRLGRSVRNLLDLVEELKNREVRIVSLKESIDSDTAAGKVFLVLCAAFSEMERELINERCQAGREIAKREGKMGRPKADEKAVEKAMRLFESGSYSVKEISEMTGISHATIYRKAKERGVVRA